MIVKDFSPYKENKTGFKDKIAIYANRPQTFNTAVSYFKKYYNATFPNGANCTFEEAKKRLPKNSKVILSVCYNSILGKYDLQYTNKTIIKANSYFWRYDFIGTLTDFLKEA